MESSSDEEEEEDTDENVIDDDDEEETETEYESEDEDHESVLAPKRSNLTRELSSRGRSQKLSKNLNGNGKE